MRTMPPYISTLPRTSNGSSAAAAAARPRIMQSKLGAHRALHNIRGRRLRGECVQGPERVVVQRADAQVLAKGGARRFKRLDGLEAQPAVVELVEVEGEDRRLLASWL